MKFISDVTVCCGFQCPLKNDCVRQLLNFRRTPDSRVGVFDAWYEKPYQQKECPYYWNKTHNEGYEDLFSRIGML